MYESTIEPNDELHLLLAIAGRKLASNPNAADFLGWIADAGPGLAPNMNGHINPHGGSTGEFFRLMGVQIYNITPLPGNDFRPNPLPKPKRNEPCLCGSGRKYKQCCQHMEGVPLLDNYNMLRHVLDAYPQNAMAELVQSRADTYAVADTAMQWLAEGEINRAMALLEPWFKGKQPLSKRHTPLFDPMMDVYLEVRKPRKREQLLERACQAKDTELKADALQRKATILMDDGDIDGAWQAFQLAQRAAPNSPALAILELTLLCAQGQTDQAKARAQFWLVRLERQGYDNPDLLSLLEECCHNPEILMGAAGFPCSADESLLNEIASALDNAPEPVAEYTAQTYGEHCVLEPSDTLAEAEQLWCDTTECWFDGEIWESADEWAALLLSVPELWQSVKVLNDLIDVVTQSELIELMPLLLYRAQELIYANIDSIQPGQTLPWGIHENRPLLSLMYKLMESYRDINALPQACAMGEQLLAFNPDDNQAVRWDLSTLYLQTEQPEKTLALANDFAEDVACPLVLNRILALYTLGRLPEAETALQKARKRHDKALIMLSKNSVKQPEMSSFGITLGGDDEAWLYREATRPQWKNAGAFAWLKKQLAR
ncbi:SEC-C metal-binding domain-containing protein [Gilvimarinus sp. SDUM040013]|uniref:SEC-C metal-binding domain-containing protein n=1 Tax=Gilvimarinus gilvus TaxID=3058038 RepID=A0ABU4RVS3_9GAMM|nr:SEC-C metal-binding domain-containing protein [Gilvimarinus sp. SDUM040013]MDO3387276.1 SEC-C metal-binding domain-containing protein [Gilvimarinus sp. SDUM040013]MDX6848965.1 SEC-C metal-binding domain-containing protein [Gilvimarinus sp. SDUM040013]